MFHDGRQDHGGVRKICEAMTSILPSGTLGAVASLSAVTLYLGNHNRKYKLWNI